MQEACPLKVRDYLAAGLPVILPYSDTAFLGRRSPDWVLEIPNCPGGVVEAKDAILDFVGKLQGLRISMAEVAPYVGCEFWEAKRVGFLEEIAKR